MRLTQIPTGHRANIFSVKWAPYNPTRLFSCAGDSTVRSAPLSLPVSSLTLLLQVRVYDRSLATNPTLSSSTVFRSSSDSTHPPWTHHEAASACTRVLRCHTSRVKRVATENSPEVFLTCSEDGTVRWAFPTRARLLSAEADPPFLFTGNTTCPPPTPVVDLACEAMKQPAVHLSSSMTASRSTRSASPSFGLTSSSSLGLLPTPFFVSGSA